MSFPNYSDPVVANWSIGHDSITLTPSIFDSAVLGMYNGLVSKVRHIKTLNVKSDSTAMQTDFKIHAGIYLSFLTSYRK